jgi:hypothetical protein
MCSAYADCNAPKTTSGKLSSSKTITHREAK